MQRKPVLFLSAAALAALLLTVLAQSQERKSPTQAELKKQFAELSEQAAALTEQHKRLAALVGDFDQAVEVRMGPGEPLKSHCLSKGTSILGGRYVQIEARSAPDEELKGERLTIYGYDTQINKFTMWTIETGCTFAVAAAGDYDPATKTFTLEGERYDRGPGKVPFRWVVRLQDAGAFTQEIQVKPPQAEQFLPVVTVKNTPKGK